ncbi:MAG: hypothetical protein JWO81_696, partial [Alphaproteobacteria bacterium]|nr:hypothetical protein [Alphaproteobacteria bacterium]
YRRWLNLDQPYSPQPYDHLAAILVQAGQTGKANSILYYGRERAREAAWQSGAWGRGLGLTLLKWTIGYGIGNGFFRAVLWVALLTAIGIAWLGAGPVGAGGKFVLETWTQKAAYSFDQLLPIIELNHSFADVKLPLFAEYYFYLHKLLGFLLGSFIAAGIAGLTQRSKS